MNKCIKSILRSILNCNYHLCALSVYLVNADRRQFHLVRDRLAKETNKNKFLISKDMIVSNFVTGCAFWEYYNLKFYERSLKNQNTFLTTYYNSVLSHRLNNYEYQDILYDKGRFNSYFEEYRKIDSIKLSDDSGKIINFIKKHDSLIFKPVKGECGHGVFVEESRDLLSKGNLESWIKSHENYLCEERLKNDEALSMLNATSLNTIRAITVLTDGTAHLIWTGIRIGKKGSCVDNISEGGACAPVDIATGIVTGEALNEHHEAVNILDDGKSLIGFEIPRWNEVQPFIQSISLRLPQMRFVAWDIAITTKGLVLIEGNHGVSNTISQVHIPTDQDGLRKELERYL